MDVFYFIKITKLYVIEFLRTINNTLQSKEKKIFYFYLALYTELYNIYLYKKIYLLK